MSFLSDMVAKLEADGVGVLGSTLFTSLKSRPPVIAGVGTIILIKTGGSGPDYIQNLAGPAWAFPGCQLTIDHDTPELAEALAYEAYFSLTTIVNRTVGSGIYRRVRPLQEPYDLSPSPVARARFVFNIVAERRTAEGEAAVSAYNLIDIFGGDKFAFTTPSVSDQYPAGSAIGAMVPDSWIVTLDGARTPTVIFEASNRLDGAGGRAKVALVRLDTLAVVAELTFTADDVNGDVQRSASFALPTGAIQYGIKQTVNSTTVGCATWGCRLLRA